MNVSMGEAGTVNVCHVGQTRFVELNISVEEMYAILQQRCGFERESITVIPQTADKMDAIPILLQEHIDEMMYVIAQRKQATA